MTTVVVSHHNDRRAALQRFSAPELSHGLWVGLWAALVAVVLVVLAGWLLGEEDVAGYRVAFRLVGTAFVACGLVAWRRRPDSYSGLLMTATGFLLFSEPLLAQWGTSTAEAIAHLVTDLWGVTIIWLLLTPLSGGRVTSTAEWVLIGAFAVEGLLEFAWYLTDAEALLTVRGAPRQPRLPRRRRRHRPCATPARRRPAAARCCPACSGSRRCCCSPSRRARRRRCGCAGSRSSRC